MLQKNILVIEDKKEIYKQIKAIFNAENDYSVIYSENNENDIKKEMINFPDIILINTENNIETYKKIQNNIDCLQIPTIVFSEKDDKKEMLKVIEQGIDSYLLKPINKKFVYYVIKNFIKLITTNRTVSPLTGLPGNIQITNEIKRRLAKKIDFSILYCDLDNFKAYNDTYGFIKGDDVIKLTADIINSVVREIGNKDDFLGHIGGDDFIAISSSEKIVEICENIIKKFDNEIISLLSKMDIERGFFEVPNRRGIIEQYPLTSLSIGVVTVQKDDILNPLEIGEIGAQVKHKAKTILGSAYVISKREIFKEMGK